MFKEHFGIDNAGLSKDQIATKLASAAQKSVKQSKNVVGAKKFLQGSGLTALGLGPFIVDKDETKLSFFLRQLQDQFGSKWRQYRKNRYMSTYNVLHSVLVP